MILINLFKYFSFKWILFKEKFYFIFLPPPPHPKVTLLLGISQILKFIRKDSINFKNLKVILLTSINFTCVCACFNRLSNRLAEASWNMMAHAQKSVFVFRRNGRVHLNRPVGVSSVDYWQPRCAASAVVMLDTPCSEVVWSVLATHCIRPFSLPFPSRASLCAITFQLESTSLLIINGRVHLNRPVDVNSVDCWQPRCAHQR